MVKSRRPARKTAVARRKTTPPRRSKRPAQRRPRKTEYIELKPIRDAIASAIEQLRRCEPTEPIKMTIERLQRCMMEFDAICDPKGKDGCGPDMAFPAP